MVDMDVVEKARPALKEILKQYAPRKVYNMDETASSRRLILFHFSVGRLVPGY